MTVFLVVLPLLVSSNPMVELREEMEDTPVFGDMVEEGQLVEEEDREEGDLRREEINEEEMLMNTEEDRLMKEEMKGEVIKKENDSGRKPNFEVDVVFEENFVDMSPDNMMEIEMMLPVDMVADMKFNECDLGMTHVVHDMIVLSLFYFTEEELVQSEKAKPYGCRFWIVLITSTILVLLFLSVVICLCVYKKVIKKLINKAKIKQYSDILSKKFV